MSAKKKNVPLTLFLTAVVLFLVCMTSVTAKAEWRKNANGTYSYYNGNTLLKNTWIGGKYYVDENGIRKTGWLNLNNKWYYLSKKGVLVRGTWLKEKNKIYYAGTDGALYTSGKYKINKHYYMFDKRGVRMTGKIIWKKKVYYFQKSNGYMMTKTWVKSGKNISYFDANGYMATSKWIGRYYVDAKGNRVTNAWQGNRYLDSNGKCMSGLQEIDGEYYYFNTSTFNKTVNTTLELNGITYKFDASGKGTAEQPLAPPKATVPVQDTYYSHPYVDDETLLSYIIYCEAGNQEYTGKLAVAMVIMNRVHSSLFPNKIREVVYAKGQFNPTWDGSLASALKNKVLDNPSSATMIRIAEECKQAAKKAIALYSGYTPGKTVYITIDEEKTEFPHLYFMTPGSFKRLGLKSKYVAIGDHVFFENWNK